MCRGLGPLLGANKQALLALRKPLPVAQNTMGEKASTEDAVDRNQLHNTRQPHESSTLSPAELYSL